ncbi:MAG: LysR family transcriptional regulator, partial [Burkholderiales bacterium]
LAFDDRRVDLVRDGFDVAIRGGEIVDSSMIVRRICGLAGVLVAAPAYLKKYGIPKTAHDLHQHRIIQLRFASGQSVAWEFKGGSGKTTLFETTSPALTVSDTEAVSEAAVLGLGIARVSLHFAWPHLVAGRLKIVLSDSNAPGKREMVLQYPHRENIAPRVKAFVEFALEKLTSDPSLAATAKDAARFAA